MDIRFLNFFQSASKSIIFHLELRLYCLQLHLLFELVQPGLRHSNSLIVINVRSIKKNSKTMKLKTFKPSLDHIKEPRI